MRKLNPTVLALLGGLIILLLIIAYFANGRNPNQDKLSDEEIAQNQQAAGPAENRCASKQTNALIRQELFRRAGQVRGNDQQVYDEVAAAAVVRMENAVLESEEEASGALNCSASISLDLPPGVAVAGGRRTLMTNLDYTIDSSGNVILRNAEAIVSPLATLTRVEQPVETPIANELAPADPLAPLPPEAGPQPAPVPPAANRPSFDCANARSRGEIAVCSDSGLSALDANMASQYRRALGASTPDQRRLLQSTRDAFLAYRDRCSSRRCIADAYTGRMREIRDIMEGRWSPPR